MKRFFVFILGLSLIAPSAIATASESEESKAKAKFREGLKHAKAARYEEAIAAFKASLSHYPSQSTFYNLANAFKEQNRYAEAIETFNELKAEYGSQIDKEIKKAMESLLAELEELVATLRIQVDQEGAVVSR
jgi:TolA-binding protein